MFTAEHRFFYNKSVVLQNANVYINIYIMRVSVHILKTKKTIINLCILLVF